jgi:hypothetical protein
MPTLRLRSPGHITNVFLREARKAVVLCCLVCLLPPLQAQVVAGAEYSSKAAFLAKFTGFVEWPPEVLLDNSSPFVLCVVGQFSFGTTLAETTRSHLVRGHRMEVRSLKRDQNFSACNLLFVSHSENKSYSKILSVLPAAGVLTVGETPDFLTAGGIMAFSMAQGNLQFDVNLQAASHANLKISSRLLMLARQIIRKAEDATT